MMRIWRERSRWGGRACSSQNENFYLSLRPRSMFDKHLTGDLISANYTIPRTCSIYRKRHTQSHLASHTYFLSLFCSFYLAPLESQKRSSLWTQLWIRGHMLTGNLFYALNSHYVVSSVAYNLCNLNLIPWNFLQLRICDSLILVHI